ncbi:GGDEF domain-containing protein [Mycobacterium rhizamassiliense]|jgi:diguanylate cyclase (GGDEF)-like protein|uniref:GGDEF domain-containing protein n=1 Tax=Mycobacterium rhizamassiliense TaxID=1841860 RepID=A0A2U3NR78_9MYCO|nr:GGDEF domain-containing protein [Mycobacterium rhizamassiliense]SPM34017.1 GGDEF domain-containing protein [Mycobacterium rhizamassiliense]
MGWVAEWWRQADHFDWLTGYLQAHGLSKSTRRALAVVAASLVLVPFNVTLGTPPLYPHVALAVSLVAAAMGAVMAVLWLRGWPTRWQSLFFVLTGCVAIGGGCFWQAEPLVGLMSCAALSVTGGYIAFFHTAKYMALNFWLAAGIGAWQAVRLAQSGQEMLAFTSFFLVMELNVIVPCAIQIVVRAVWVDLLRANRDPLTGLLNRRACDRAVVGRMLASANHMSLAVAMVDLDRFKTLNDTHGHAAGDEALIEVAAALTAACGDSAVVGRVGGEEFLIADIVTTEQLCGWGEEFCDAVAAITHPVTASVGIASLPLRSAASEHPDRAFHQLMAHADTAMYEAKRCGGNQTRNHEVAV